MSKKTLPVQMFTPGNLKENAIVLGEKLVKQ
ncbi:hypothetical protein CM49_01126 [Paenibacillus sp. P1XP2]|nr:hypothetical protein CM49_01126 [Paenibacillus sp. P1XP2]